MYFMVKRNRSANIPLQSPRFEHMLFIRHTGDEQYDETPVRDLMLETRSARAAATPLQDYRPV
jgi:hypothetical protein